MEKYKQLWKRLLLAVTAMLALTLFAPGLSQSARAARLSQKSLTMVEGTKTRLKVKGTRKKVVWKSSKKKVATVSGGVVRARKRGTAVITAKTGGKTLRCKVTVKEKPKLVASVVVTGKASDSAAAITVSNIGSRKAVFLDEAYLVNEKEKTRLVMVDLTGSLQSGTIQRKSKSVVRPLASKKAGQPVISYIRSDLRPMKITRNSRIEAYFTYDGLKYKVTATYRPNKAGKVTRISGLH